MIALTSITLYSNTSEITESEYQQYLRISHDIASWIKTRPAYAVSANQLGYTKRFFVCHRKYKKWGLPAQIIFNPYFTPAKDSKKFISSEYCLSYPGQQFKLERYSSIDFVFYDPISNLVVKRYLTDLPAIICQHEIMHLDGIDERKIHNDV